MTRSDGSGARRAGGLLVVLALALATPVLGAAAASTGASLARIVDLKSSAGLEVSVTVEHPGADPDRPGPSEDARVGQELSEADRLKTGFASVAVLDFGGKATVVVEELTQFRVGIFKLGTVTQVELWLKSGGLQAQVAKEAAGRTQFIVTTPTVTASVRGTEINFIRFAPQTGTQIAMGATGRLLGERRRSAPTDVARRERLREDVKGDRLLDERKLTYLDAKTDVTPAITTEERTGTEQQPINTQVNPGVNSTGSAQSPLPVEPAVPAVQAETDPLLPQRLALLDAYAFEADAELQAAFVNRFGIDRARSLNAQIKETKQFDALGAAEAADLVAAAVPDAIQKATAASMGAQINRSFSTLEPTDWFEARLAHNFGFYPFGNVSATSVNTFERSNLASAGGNFHTYIHNLYPSYLMSGANPTTVANIDTSLHQAFPGKGGF